MEKTRKCLICGTEFNFIKNSRVVCEKQQCRVKLRNLRKSQELEKSDKVLNEDYVKCQWCNLNVTRIYGSHMTLYHPNKNTFDYRTEFPGFPLASKKDNKNIAKAYIKFTQSDEGKKILSENAKGNKNPNSKNNTTEEQRKSRSPFSKAFYTKNGKTELEAEKEVAKFAQRALKNRVTTTQLEYWLKLTGNDEEEAKKLLKERQQTFTLKNCIEKHGNEKGREVWMERQKKWISNHRKKSYSFISQELFWKIQDELKYSPEEIKFATFNNGERTEHERDNREEKLFLDNRLVLPDFIHLLSKKIIEFDGVYYHRKTPENKSREAQRDEDLKRNGYEVLHINEMEFKNDPDGTLKKCINFLNEKNPSETCQMVNRSSREIRVSSPL